LAGQIKVDSINADSNLALKIANTAVAFIDSSGLRPISGNVNLDATATSKLYLPSANTVAIQTAGVTGLSISSSQVVTLPGTLSVTGVTTLTGGLNAALPVLSGGTGVTTSTGTGAVVLGTSPTITGATITVAATAAPAFSAYLNSVQNTTTNTWTKATLDAEEFDTNSNFSSNRFTPTVAGYYQINGCVCITNSSAWSTAGYAAIYKNGSRYKSNFVNFTGGGGAIINEQQFPVSAVISLNGTTDYIELYGYITAGGTPGFLSGASITYMSGAMIRSA
jgi:hypothetical protein